MNLNFKAIIVGALVALCFAPFLDVLIFSILGGLVAGLWIADNYLDGAINGITSTFITSLIFFSSSTFNLLSHHVFSPTT
jgi:hypothetical protein